MKLLLYKAGRLLQLAGMIILPFAMAGNVLEKIDLKTMLILSGVGLGIFGVGWLLQEASGLGHE